LKLSRNATARYSSSYRPMSQKKIENKQVKRYTCC
jgi:hypothetical protein